MWVNRSRVYNRAMFRKWWCRRQERRTLNDQRDAAVILDARREGEHDRHDPHLSDKLPPIYPDTGGGPL
jgi:hypothetical protein